MVYKTYTVICSVQDIQLGIRCTRHTVHFYKSPLLVGSQNKQQYTRASPMVSKNNNMQNWAVHTTLILITMFDKLCLWRIITKSSSDTHFHHTLVPMMSRRTLDLVLFRPAPVLRLVCDLCCTVDCKRQSFAWCVFCVALSAAELAPLVIWHRCIIC